MYIQSCDVFVPSYSTGLSVSIPNNDLVVKEGDDIIVTCLPSSLEVAVEWDISTAHGILEPNTVEYDEPLRHTLVIHSANISHQGNYTCRVVGDIDGVIPSATAAIKVRESKE